MASTCRDFWLSYERTDFVPTLRRIDAEFLTPWYRGYGLARVLRYIDAYGYRGFFTLLVDAVHAGRLPVLMFLHHTYGSGCDVPHLVDLAACSGHLDVLSFLHQNGYSGCSTSAMDGAAALGHVHIVKFLHEYRQEGCSVQALDFAAQNGHLDVVTFLKTHRNEGGTPGAIDFAAQNGHFDVADYLSQFEAQKPSKLWMRFYWVRPGESLWRHQLLLLALLVTCVSALGVIMAFSPLQINAISTSESAAYIDNSSIIL
ncbi:hypothetical protein SPRG_11826 [Saprolegnia parasitica CBS 223.65]|uniref:Uncharacterized protein n=1 Tax=Saprolegnia parasitica (strain CBS 223.65) TaxID=695850 RepID=A0A067BWQ5_SAPPC|nr:hypothetical protein SPRG_11826 [Saprolegnia parasitica CBS 223.65]KDO22979.1 hypothetical protein SPRG_11826 [Saprolegnia parasitica CBS 223.65]|eukprot:XP_012206270.1 hypothetical protein SPRG_11826 [Saprolegnia parasitica CBS 223.65]